MAGQAYDLTHARTLRYLVETSLELVKRKSAVHNGLDLALPNVLDSLLEILKSCPDRSHNALLVHNHGDGVASKL